MPMRLPSAPFTLTAGLMGYFVKRTGREVLTDDA